MYNIGLFYWTGHNSPDSQIFSLLEVFYNISLYYESCFSASLKLALLFKIYQAGRA